MKITHSRFESPVGRACTYHGPDRKKKLWFSRVRVYNEPKDVNVVAIIVFWVFIFLLMDRIRVIAGMATP